MLLSVKPMAQTNCRTTRSGREIDGINRQDYYFRFNRWELLDEIKNR